LSETRAAEVVLDIELDEAGAVHLVLANCGDAVATDVSVKFSRELRGIGDVPPVSALPVFRRLGVLRPGREVRVLWHSAEVLLKPPDEEEPFSCTVSWTERGGRRQESTYRHDLAVLAHLPTGVGRCAPPYG
jgi:hypothetical protein